MASNKVVKILPFTSSNNASDDSTPKMRQKSRQKKRSDIQYLRGLAIAAVLGFHIRPEIVPQGFLGVDMSVSDIYN